MSNGPMQLTPDESAFLKRMVPHVLAGKTFEDAARAVLDDDERLWLAICDLPAGDQWCGDILGSRGIPRETTGTEIRKHITAEVYRRLRL